MAKSSFNVDISGLEHTEEWRAIPGYEEYYEVSDLGRVRSLPRTITCRDGRVKTYKGKILNLYVSSTGYPTVALSKEGIVKRWSMHRLVLFTFCGEPAEGMEACHGNDIRTDNRLENLRWDSHRENVRDCVTRGRHRIPPAEINAAKTHCHRGHPFDEENTLVRPEGRSCKECRRVNDRERYQRDQSLGIVRQYNSDRSTHCKRGHEFTEDNTYIRPNGKRNCIQCRQIKWDAWRQEHRAS